MTDRRDLVGPGLLAFGLVQLATAAFIVIAPGAFADTLGSFGARNDHLARDIATLYLALGVVLVLAARNPSWRRPAIAAAAVQHGAHAANHAIDIGDADPGWIGPVDLAILSISLAVLVWLWRATTATPRAPSAR